MRILIIDDDAAILDDIRAALLPGGYDVITESNPVEALARFEQEPFDVVISDIRMPEMSGIDVLKKVRESHPKLPVIIMTAYGDVETAIACINNHAYGFLPKPLDFNELLDMIHRIEEENRGETPIDYQKLKEAYKELEKAYQNLSKMVDNIN
ncbi:response regulator [Thermospira aquatica]|uniref:Response regulator n=1 Tax=Thermospira aquatica TaxID=2828656 RepID=A0AAX3BE29_9SPIR|nr:response regulator [Thermospira aquatica]URA10360.1 response regulator [Thermospira aquatica]